MSDFGICFEQTPEMFEDRMAAILGDEERMHEYLSKHRPEPEPPFEWTSDDDLDERVDRGEYDDVIYPVSEPGNTGRCQRCGDTVARTASNPYGWVRIDREDRGVCMINPATGRQMSHVGCVVVCP
jgi:hypothetical protein